MVVEHGCHTDIEVEIFLSVQSALKSTSRSQNEWWYLVALPCIRSLCQITGTRCTHEPHVHRSLADGVQRSSRSCSKPHGGRACILGGPRWFTTLTTLVASTLGGALSAACTQGHGGCLRAMFTTSGQDVVKRFLLRICTVGSLWYFVAKEKLRASSSWSGGSVDGRHECWRSSLEIEDVQVFRQDYLHATLVRCWRCN